MSIVRRTVQMKSECDSCVSSHAIVKSPSIDFKDLHICFLQCHNEESKAVSRSCKRLGDFSQRTVSSCLDDEISDLKS